VWDYVNRLRMRSAASGILGLRSHRRAPKGHRSIFPDEKRNGKYWTTYHATTLSVFFENNECNCVFCAGGQLLFSFLRLAVKVLRN
jgi:hypothetical protein